MKKEHSAIIELITQYLREHPNQRFGQALFNLGVNEFVDKANPVNKDYRLRDIYSDSDAAIRLRIEAQLAHFKKQKDAE